MTAEDEKDVPPLQRLKPFVKGQKRTKPPPSPYSIGEQFSVEEKRAYREERAEKAQAAAEKYLNKVKCRICGRNEKDDGLLRPPKLYYRAQGKQYDLSELSLKPPPTWKVPMILGLFDAVCEPCVPKWMKAHAKAAAIAAAERKAALRAAHKRQKEHPVTDKKAYAISKRYMYGALKAKDPVVKRKLMSWHYQWDAKARREGGPDSKEK